MRWYHTSDVKSAFSIPNPIASDVANVDQIVNEIHLINEELTCQLTVEEPSSSFCKCPNKKNGEAVLLSQSVQCSRQFKTWGKPKYGHSSFVIGTPRAPSPKSGPVLPSTIHTGSGVPQQIREGIWQNVVHPYKWHHMAHFCLTGHPLTVVNYILVKDMNLSAVINIIVLHYVQYLIVLGRSR